jgi:competence protein ComEC
LIIFSCGSLLASFSSSKITRSLSYQLAKSEAEANFSGISFTESRQKGSNLYLNALITKINFKGKTWSLSEPVTIVVSLKSYQSTEDTLSSLTTRENWQSSLLDPKQLKLRLEPGYLLVFTGAARLPHRDFATKPLRFLQKQGVFAFIYTDLTRLKIKKQKPSFFFSFINRLRSKIKQNIARSLPPDQAALLTGIVLGDITALSEQIQQDFRTTGVSHILAVSGLNVGLLVSFFLLVFRFIRLSPKLQYLPLVAIIITYAFLTQGRPSVLRASAMAIIGLGAWLLGKKQDLIASLSVAGLVLLIYNPFFLYDISFQLSFIATLSILLILPILQSLMENIPSILSLGLSVTLAAQLGVAPLLVYYFGQFSIISFLANLLIVPLAGFSLVLGFIAALTAFLSAWLAKLIFFPTSLLLGLKIMVANLLAKLPGAAIFIEQTNILILGSYYLVLFLICSYLKSKKIKLKTSQMLFSFLLILTFSIWWQLSQTVIIRGIETHFIDVGQGDAALLRTGERAVVLFDGGGGKFKAAQFLRSKGIRRLDMIILSHAHKDHLKGLLTIVETFPVKKVLDAGYPHSSNYYREFRKRLKRYGISYSKVKRGQQFLVGRKLKLTILHPPQQFLSGTGADVNNNSVVTKVNYEDFSLLMLGDIEKAGEKNLLQANQKIKSKVIKIAHHGSNRSSSVNFLRKVKPKIAIISVGKSNKYGHPSSIVLARLNRLGVKVYRTDKSGDVKIISDGWRLWVKLARR